MIRIIFYALILTTSFNTFAQTQTEINNEAYADLQKSDKELNKIYQEVLATYKSDSKFISSLKKSQKIWIKFRDAELEMKYPNYREPYDNSIHPMCRANYLKELTEDRIKQLQLWLNGIDESDKCSGSVKVNR
ncbi:lysozyme inhibitor LprI family protein [Aquimarina sp. W85]|uniref:lysozyme inhibitor LprI family protein n=1 Tax=Aquimarina rhodophyticola TaxID=3342246 RepID=UPI00366CFD35